MSQVYGVGRREEWAAFEKRNSAFVGEFPVLERALRAFEARSGRVATSADALILTIGRHLCEDFFEILVMAANGYGLAALRLLRSMYERAVTARYVHLHPDQADRFVRWHPVQLGKLASAIQEAFGEDLPEDERELLQDASEKKDAVVAEFQVTDCRKCGTKKLGHAWGPDLVQMARSAGRLRHLVVSCYYIPLLHAHPSAQMLKEHLKPTQDGRFRLAFGPRQEDAEGALMHAHMILLDDMALQCERFGGEALEDEVHAAEEAFLRVWSPAAAGP